MKTLCPAILGLEAVSLLLAILVLRSSATPSAGGAWVLAGLALLAVLVASSVRRAPGTGVVLGWGVQGLVVVSGLLVPVMFIVGIIFGAVWWAAVHYGGKADRLQAQRGDPGQQQGGEPGGGQGGGGSPSR